METTILTNGKKNNMKYQVDTVTPEHVEASIRKFRVGGMIEETDVLEIDDENDDFSLDMLSGGKWFEKFPEKNLGTIEYAKSRYGKDIKVVVGDISNLGMIQASDDFAQFIKYENIGVSAIADTLDQSIGNPANEQFINDIISKSNTSIGIKAVKKKARLSGEVPADPLANIQTAAEVFRTLNPDISEEEVKAYVWHKAAIGQRMAQAWYDLCNYYGDEREESEMVRDWIKSGLLCYFDGQLLPQVLYLSGNMYEKISRIVKAGENSGQDIEHIEAFGTDVLNQQIALINRKYSEVYAKRLILTGNSDDNSLIIKPISDLARNFMVSSLVEFEKFKWFAAKGAPNWERDSGNDHHKTVFDELSLKDAFCYWMISKKSKIDIKGNITYADIIYFYLDGRTKVLPSNIITEQQEAIWRAELARTKSKAMGEGERLFLVFLDEQLELNDRIRLETSWNSQYNNYLAPDFNKIPVAFSVAREFGGESPFVVKPEKREAVAFLFNEGCGCLAYDVGVGKTMSAIMATEQFLVAGYCKRPFIVVPNQTFKQWVSEIKNILPHRQVNPLFNLGAEFIDSLMDEEGNIQFIDEGSITVITYEGFRNIGFNEQTEKDILGELYAILNQGGAEDKMSEKKRAGFHEKLATLIGRGLKGTVLSIESLGLDYVCFDEAHANKKVFTTVKGTVDKETGKKDSKNPYSINSGMPSDTALKAFMITQYILRNNNYRNVVMLTATPFTNSPLEVYSMLAMLAYHHLERLGINNLKDFFDTYIDASTELTINHKLQPQYKQVIKGFNNLPALQRIILRFFNYKDGDDVGVVRPNKIVIPYLKKLVNNVITDLPENERVGCYISMNEIQRDYMAEIVAYAEGQGELGMSFTFTDDDDSGEDSISDSATETLSEAALSGEDKSGVRALKAMNHSRNLALSPYLYAYNNLGRPNHKTYVENSPKIQYVMDCVRSVKEYHEKKNEPVSGQVIYMDRGIQYFPLLVEYLVKVVGFKEHEIGVITSKGMSIDKKRAVQDGFLGRKYNDKIQDYEDLPDEARIKVLIGSSSIKEGMNLQKKSTVLYNMFLDWNPTDMIQLAGRIWRQQNEFLYVRIVNPLMIDSIDIFMFQKLEEKTSRINTIWSNDGRSVLKIEEVNPTEIKFALIKDPKVIAKIEIDEKKVHIQDDVRSSEKIIERLKEYEQKADYIKAYQDEVDELVKKISPDRNFTDNDSKVKAILAFFRKGDQYDEEGKIMLDRYTRYDFATQQKYGRENISAKDKISRPYFFDNYLVAMRFVEKEKRDLLRPRSIKPEGIQQYVESQREVNEKSNEQIKFLESPDYVELRVKEILDYREKNKIREKTVPELVSEFKTLNHLLSEKRIKRSAVAIEPKKEVILAEPTDEDLKATIGGLEVLLLMTDDATEIKNITATLEGLKLLI